MCTKHNYPAILVAFVLFFVISCKNDDDLLPDDNSGLPGDSIPPTGVKRLLSQTVTWFVVQPEGDTGGHHGGGNPGDTTFLHSDINMYKYNSKGFVTEVNGMRFIYNASGHLSMTILDFDTVYYLRDEGKLSAIATAAGYYDGGHFADTTRFFYTGDRITLITSTRERAEITIGYDANGDVTGRFITRSFNGQTFCDSLLYTWENGNVIKLISRAGHPNENMHYQRRYKYDNHPCFISTAGYPDEYLFVRELTQLYGKYPLIYYDPYPWRFNCANNPTEFTEMTEFKTVHNHFHIDYDMEGYPTKIVGMNAIIKLIYNR